MGPQVNLPLTRPRASLLLSPLHLAKTLLLLRQRRVQLRVGIMLLKSLAGQLLGGGREDGLAEVFGPELADQRQARRGEQHLLPHGSGVGDVGDGDQRGRGVIAAENDVESFFLLDVRGQEGVDVGGEGGGAPGV